MIDDQLSPEERQLIQQMQAVAKPKLDAAAREAIRQSMLSEFRGMLLPGQPPPPRIRPRFSFHTTPVWVAAAVVVLVVGLLILQNGTLNNAVPGEDSTPTATLENQIAVVPTQTSTLPVVAPTSTEVMVTLSVAPEFSPSLTLTLPPTAQVIPSGTPIPLPTPTTDRLVTIEGPVTSITDHVITIYGFQIEVEPEHPILQIIDVGDVVRIEGVLNDSGVVLATVVSNLPDAAAPAADNRATVGLDGPVEAIDGNILVVNGISVQLAPNDPLLQTVQLGSFVSVQGNFQTSNAGIVLVVVNIAIVNTISVESNCWYHVDAMGMGHWHCDGMGMGMGMGNDGMGMGMGMGE